MPLQIGDLFRILKRRQPKALYVATIGLTTGFAPDQRQRVMQLVIRDAQAPHDLGGAVLRALQAAAGGGAAIIRTLAPRRSSPRPANGGAPTPSDAHASRRYASFIRSMTACSRTLG